MTIHWFRRWQEFAGWLPLTVAAVLLAWLVLGALLPWGAESAIESLIELAIRLAYALAAAGVARLVWRRWRVQLDDDQVRDYWRGVMAGERGPLIAHSINAIVYLGVLIALLTFFAVAS